MSSQYTIEQRRAFQDLVQGQRKARGWNQTKAGEVSGVGQRAISELERGPLPGTPFMTMAKVAYAYGISLDHIAVLLGLADDTEPEDASDFEKRTGFTRDFFKLTAEEQARARRVFNYSVFDMLHVSGSKSAFYSPSDVTVEAGQVEEDGQIEHREQSE